MELLTANGRHTAVSIVGSGPPVVFLHNAGTDHHIWDDIVEALRPRYTTIAVDLYGFGASSAEVRPLSLNTYIDQLDAVIETLGLPRVRLVGHCVGGATVWGWALRKPERVERLAVFSPATPRTLGRGPYGLFPTLARTRPTRAALVRTVAQLYGRSPTRHAVIRSLFGSGPTPRPGLMEHLDTLFERRDALESMANVVDNFASFGQLDAAVRPEHFPPTLLLWGTRNTVLPYGGHRHVRQVLQPDHFASLRGAGHLMMTGQPQRVLDHLAPFLDEG